MSDEAVQVISGVVSFVGVVGAFNVKDAGAVVSMMTVRIVERAEKFPAPSFAFMQMYQVPVGSAEPKLQEVPERPVLV